jgi:hypothetical protein
MPKFVLFVHGYSESSLGAYFQFPRILKESVPGIEEVALAAFDSLDDGISIDDFADAMEVRIAALVANQNWVIGDTAIICHSTGALIARRWILNRITEQKPIPSHLITMAGANHGSTLAHMGKSVLGYFQKLALHHELSVGQGVLTDLEYGSDFLLRLNKEWLDAWNNGPLADLFAFSMGGDTAGSDPTMQVFWQTHEPGSDNTVRISGANLNYAYISVVHDENTTSVDARYPLRRVPHLVLTGYSHYGAATGILGNVHTAADPPMAAVVKALGVATAPGYETIGAQWRQTTDAWTAAHADLANSTAIFTLLDRNGASINDSMIAILKENALGGPQNAVSLTDTQPRLDAMTSVSDCILRHSPIQNDMQCGSYTFYLNYAQYVATSPHLFHIEFGQSALIGKHNYPHAPLLFTQPTNLQHTIEPNECTYLNIRVGRASNDAYAIYRWDSNLDMDATTFPPFIGPYRIAPPADQGGGANGS